MTNKTFYLTSSFEAKALSKQAKSLKIAGYANTTAKDRTGDVVTAEAWAKGVENFRKNPIMLYQHKHDCPIGRFDKITVDKKGIYVEGTVSSAAETNHGIHTLIKDGALKSFSVGFRVKDGKYNRSDDSTTITDVELLEISIVSVPCNQDSLFSLRKGFSSDNDYANFVETLADDSEEKSLDGIKAGVTTYNAGHYHTLEVDGAGNGVTTYASHMANHSHTIIGGKIMETEGHSHEISFAGKPSEEEEDDLMDNNSTERPLSPTEQLVVDGKELEVDVTKAEILEDDKVTDEEDEETIVRDPNESIPFVNLLATEATTTKLTDLETDKVEETANTEKLEEVTITEKLEENAANKLEQNPNSKLLEIDGDEQSCDNNSNVEEKDISQEKSKINMISEETIVKTSFKEELHEDSTKENDQMAEQVVESIDLSEVAKANAAKNTRTVPNTVAEPRVAQLVEKTGEAILREADAQEKDASRASDEVKELKAELSRYKDQLKAHTSSKMTYSENSRTTSQFSEKEMANAVLLAKLFNKQDVFDTKYGTRMKAVTSVDQFLSNFSSNIYTEMEQQLIIANMFNRLSVDAKTFRVPVADEDTDGDVAMFKSGTFATGVGDLTNVPTSNQNTISSVEFTPHKFMATTHLAKDEEEDNILPLLDFLRQSATRRLARAIDKSILRGTGALTGFTASPTNSISVGAGYASVITGIAKLAATASLGVSTGSSTDKADPSDIAAARSAMGKYGLQLGNDLVYVTSIEGYNNLVTTSDFRTVDKFGPNATYLTGSVGAVYGIPIVISEFLDVVGTTGNQIGTLLYKPGFMIAERRGIEIESEYEARQQVTAMYMSTRFDFKALTTNSGAALDSAKYAYAVNVLAG